MREVARHGPLVFDRVRSVSLLSFRVVPAVGTNLELDPDCAFEDLVRRQRSQGLEYSQQASSKNANKVAASAVQVTSHERRLFTANKRCAIIAPDWSIPIVDDPLAAGALSELLLGAGHKTYIGSNC